MAVNVNAFVRKNKGNFIFPSVAYLIINGNPDFIILHYGINDDDNENVNGRPASVKYDTS